MEDSGRGVDVDSLLSRLDERLAAADADLTRLFPGERAGRQPIHTVYVPADRFTAGLTAVWGKAALDALHAQPDALSALVPGGVDLLARVEHKLAMEPIEDLRIDFEDGYGTRSDADEDAAVDAAAAAVGEALSDGMAPPYLGIRFKSFEAPTRARGVRTLARFIDRVNTAGVLPRGLVVTLPKVTSVDQVEAMVETCGVLEAGLGLAHRALSFEIQVETPQAILGPDGTALIARMIHSSDGRCTGLHYGTYDYSASCGISAAQQSMEHPAADHAKAVMQVAAASTGVRLSDGSTNVIPVGDPARVRSAWELHARLVRRSLDRGYYQGWDLHPAQLPTRYLATFAFYRADLASIATRLRNYVEQIDAGVMDEPATARALADHVARAVDCGASDDAEIENLTGLARADVLRLARRPATD